VEQLSMIAGAQANELADITDGRAESSAVYARH